MGDNLHHEKLLKSLQSGDESAFTEIYNMYHKGIYIYVMSFIKIPHLAEDLVHEVFMKIWEKRSRISITTSFTAYLYRIARNVSLDSLKKNSRDAKTRQEIIQWMEPSALILDNKNKPNNFYEDLYLEAVSALTPQRQKVFILCREKGKTYDETAATLGISKNTVKEHMAKSISFLRNFLYERGIYMLFLAHI